MNPVPKPQKRPPKPRQPLRRKRPGVRRRVAGPRPSDALAHPKPRREAKTAHGRRQRETGRMLFYKSMPCMLADGMAMLRTVSTSQARVWVDFCDGSTEAAHLGPRKGYRAPDNQTAPLCRRHHREPGIDGNVGGRAKWYVALSPEDRLRLRQILWTQADLLWLALPVRVREEWNRRATARTKEDGSWLTRR